MTADPIQQAINREASRVSEKLAMFDELVEAVYRCGMELTIKDGDKELIKSLHALWTRAKEMRK